MNDSFYWKRIDFTHSKFEQAFHPYGYNHFLINSLKASYTRVIKGILEVQPRLEQQWNKRIQL